MFIVEKTSSKMIKRTILYRNISKKQSLVIYIFFAQYFIILYFHIFLKFIQFSCKLLSFLQ